MMSYIDGVGNYEMRLYSKAFEFNASTFVTSVRFSVVEQRARPTTSTAVVAGQEASYLAQAQVYATSNDDGVTPFNLRFEESDGRIWAVADCQLLSTMNMPLVGGNNTTHGVEILVFHNGVFVDKMPVSLSINSKTARLPFVGNSFSEPGDYVFIARASWLEFVPSIPGNVAIESYGLWAKSPTKTVGSGGAIAPPVGNPLDSASGWAKEGITAAIGKGFVPTDIQGSYTNVITRQEFCRMAVKWLEYMLGKDINTIVAERGIPERMSHTFSDTTDPNILAAYRLGVTGGTSAPTATTPGLFTPSGQFSREQAATMIMNTCKAAGMDVSNTAPAGFTDIGTASSWAVDGINYVRNAGIMQGTSTTPLVFSPKQNYTREQSIITFNNIK
jgi:hypothetical protein